MPRYVETCVREGDGRMAETIRTLRDEKFEGVTILDHAPSMTREASRHARRPYAPDYTEALVQKADALGPCLAKLGFMATE